MAIFGHALDSLITIRLMSHKVEFEKLGYEFPVSEVGLFLPKHPTAKELTSGLNFALNLAFLVPIFFFPLIGFVALLVRLLAVSTNLRQEKRIKLVLKTLQSQPAKPTFSQRPVLSPTG